MMTITFHKLFGKLAEFQVAACAKQYYPHAAKGALEGINSIINGKGITEPQAKDLLRVCNKFCDTMEMMDLQDWLKDEHDVIILLDELSYE